MQNQLIILAFITLLASSNTFAQCTPATFQGVFNVTQTTADPTISNNGGGTNYLEYGSGVFTPGTGATPGTGGTMVSIPANTNHYIITGLQPGTTYYLYTRKNCSGTWSTNSFMYMFMTLPFTMTITSAVPANICNDAVFNVSFVTNATPFAGNTYALELSDPNGSFGGPFPLIIGTINSTSTSGSFAVNLGPQSPLIVGGSGYRVRMTSSNPQTTGTDNGSNITISEMVQNGTSNIQTSGSLFFCGPASRTFTVGSILHATNYVWAAPAGAIITSGQGTQSCTISFPATGASGFVSVFGNNANCNGPSLNVLVNVYPMPAMPILQNVFGCSGTPIDLALVLPGGSFSVTNPYTGPSTTYTATVTDINGCTSLPGAPANITVNPLPSATITSDGPTAFCNGGSVGLKAPSNPNCSYQWRVNGVNIPGATSQNYTATVSGNYKVKVTKTTTGCTKVTPTASVVSVNAVPSATVTPQGPVSFCIGDHVVLQANAGAGLTYKWKKNGNFIAGATSIAYTATTAGTYKVEVKNANGCSKVSSGIVVTVPCREVKSIPVPLDDIQINVYPNPYAETFSLLIKPFTNRSGAYSDEFYKVIIKDILGRQVSAEIHVAAGKEIQLGKELPSGFYLVEIISGVSRKMIRIEKV